MVEKKLAENLIVAVIDCGSNTFHLSVYKIDKSLNFQIIFDENIAVALGQKGYAKKSINKEAFERGLNALIKHKNSCDKWQAKIILATGTSAIRDADNGSEFVQKVWSETGITIKTITGKEEAEYIFNGSSLCLNGESRNALLLDIGGGSCEFIHHRGTDMLEKFSFNIGVSRILEKFNPEDILTNDLIEEIKLFVDDEIDSLKDYLQNQQIELLTGTSGTFDSFTSMIQQNDIPHYSTQLFTEFGLESFDKLSHLVLYQPLQKRLLVKGLIPFRASLIHLSVVIVSHILQAFKISKIKALKYNLKEGVLLEYLRNQK